MVLKTADLSSQSGQIIWNICLKNTDSEICTFGIYYIVQYKAERLIGLMLKFQ